MLKTGRKKTVSHMGDCGCFSQGWGGVAKVDGDSNEIFNRENE